MRRDERGAVAVVAAFVLVVVMGVGATVIDIGMQRVARADMQAVADVVALDLARDLDGRTVAQLQPVLVTDAQASLARNVDAVGEDSPVLDIELGQMGATGAFVPMSTGTPTAVRVRAATSVGFAFGGFTGVDSGAATRSAVSTADSNACFRLGSFAASLRTGDSALAGVFESMLGDPDALGLNLKGVSYDGLLNSYVDLGLLAAKLGAGSPEALVDSGSVSVQKVFSASAEVLNSQGDSAGSATLGAIAAKVSTTTVVDLGDVLSVGDGQAVGSSINVVDLLGGVGLSVAEKASVADHSNLLSTGVAWAAPHVSSGSIELRVIEPPRQGCGTPGSLAAMASTGQVEFTSDFGFELPNKIGTLNVGTVSDPTSTKATIHVDAELAGAQGRLTGLTCLADGTETRVMVDTRLAKLEISLPFHLSGQVSLGGLSLVNLDLSLTMKSTVSTVAHIGTQDTVYDVPPHDYTDPEPSPGASSYVALDPPKVSIDLAHSSATVAGLKVDLGTLNLGSVLDQVTSSVIGTSLGEVTTNIDAALVPVAHLLGVRFAGADVFGVPTPTCARPRLAG